MDRRPAAFFAGSLIGNQVKDGNGASLGRIEELVIDVDTGHVKSVVLSMGDSPAFGNAACAIPWEALKLDRDGSNGDGLRVGAEDGSGAGKPDKSYSVYTYPVSRAH